MTSQYVKEDVTKTDGEGNGPRGTNQSEAAVQRSSNVYAPKLSLTDKSLDINK